MDELLLDVELLLELLDVDELLDDVELLLELVLELLELLELLVTSWYAENSSVGGVNAPV